MIKVGDIMKTVEDKAYPYTVEVLEIYPCNTKAKCLCTDPDTCFHKEYDIDALRHTSAKEIFEDVVKFYHLEEPSGMAFYSQKFIEWLKTEASNYEKFRDEKMEECDAEGIDISDLDSDELWEFDQAGEKSGWLIEIAEMIEAETEEISSANPTITVSVPGLNGRFVANASTDTSYLGIDVEFVPDEEKNWVSNPRVLFEAHEDGEIDVHLWTDPQNEDYTAKNSFKLQ